MHSIMSCCLNSCIRAFTRSSLYLRENKTKHIQLKLLMTLKLDIVGSENALQTKSTKTNKWIKEVTHNDHVPEVGQNTCI